MKRQLCFSVSIILSLCLLFVMIAEAQRDDSLPEAKSEHSAQSAENKGSGTSEKPYNGTGEKKADERDKQSQPTPKVEDRERPDKSEKPSFGHELAESADKRAAACRDAALDNSWDGESGMAACAMGAIVDGVKETVNIIRGETNNCQLPTTQKKYKKLPTY